MCAPPRIMGAMGAAPATYGQAGLPAGAPAVELVAEITQQLKTPSPPLGRVTFTLLQPLYLQRRHQHIKI